METTVLAELAGTAALIAMLVPMVVAMLKKAAPQYVDNDNAALASAIVGCALTLGANALGLFVPPMAYGAAALAGIITGLTATGAYGAIKKIGVKKTEARER